MLNPGLVSIPSIMLHSLWKIQTVIYNFTFISTCNCLCTSEGETLYIIHVYKQKLEFILKTTLQPIYGSTALVDFGSLFSFLILYTVDTTPWTQGRYLRTEQHKQGINAHASMPQVRFEPTIPLLEWAKTVHTLDRAATVIGT
jgi:hypothetical protein